MHLFEFLNPVQNVFYQKSITWIYRNLRICKKMVAFGYILGAKKYKTNISYLFGINLFIMLLTRQHNTKTEKRTRNELQ